MIKLEKIHKGTRLTGLTASGTITICSAQWIGQQVLNVVFRTPDNQLYERLLYRDDEVSLCIPETGSPWSFDGDGELLRLVSEAYRINLAWLFDPFTAITTSLIEPLPHQISAVYDEMLPRQPMRFLLADDPGSGKTIMAGLFIKELILRGDLERCLVVSPGSLTDQWQDELWEKFSLDFDLLTRDMIKSSKTANPFENNNFLIARMDQLARNEELKQKLLDAEEWDLIIVDEAHRMSGHFFGNEVSLTKRYKLGLTIGSHCRNFLIMTATPHNGKEEDFQIFLALLDSDRFEGKPRHGVHVADPADLMRRLVKEDLLQFNGKPLFPERRSYTVQYELTLKEAYLYTAVTEYVKDEMNRAERFVDQGEGKRRVNVGFALMILQRRLASSPEAIFRSLVRRRERLESTLKEQRLILRGKTAELQFKNSLLDEIVNYDDAYEGSPQEEREELETKLVNHATAAATIQELKIEIERLKELQSLAKDVVLSGQDAKWNQLNTILDDPLMIDEEKHRRKLVIFSEFKDTLAYLGRRIRNRLGRAEAVVEIHGSVTREERRRVVHSFMNDPEVLVLIANDAAGEGVNLQRAHLMVNYDLPWNPNRLEQRFGRIHRIGQREVCHLWNLIAKDTREGDVYLRLLEKLEVEREALGGKVYDVLGRLFDQTALRKLFMEAIQYGDDPKVKARLEQAVEGVVNRKHLQTILSEHALVHDTMDTSRIQAIREEMDRAQARRLQPHFIQSFFFDAFKRLGGIAYRREPGRWEVKHVPTDIRMRDRHIGQGAPVLQRYERICFEKDKIARQPRAELVCPGSPLLTSTIDLILERHGELLKRGSVLIDEDDPGKTPHLLFYLEHAVQDGRKTRRGEQQTISKRMQFVEVDPAGIYNDAGTAPYLDYRSASKEERSLLKAELDADWLKKDWDNEVLTYAINHITPKHVEEVRSERIDHINKVHREVKARLTREINYWDRRTQDLKEKERAGKKTQLPAKVAQDRADKLADRLKIREAQLDKERHIFAAMPRITGGSLIIPGGLLLSISGAERTTDQHVDEVERKRVELLAMKTVIKTEQALGRIPRDVSAKRGLGYDIESKDPKSGRLYFIEVKGRKAGAATVTLTKNEILAALNASEFFRLAIVVIDGDSVAQPVYIKDFDFGQPGFGQTSANYEIKTLLKFGGAPA